MISANDNGDFDPYHGPVLSALCAAHVAYTALILRLDPLDRPKPR